MATNRLNATITIGGAISAGLRSAIGSTVSGLRQIGATVRDVQRQQQDVARAIAANRAAGRSVVELERQYRDLERTIQRLRVAQQRLSANHNATQANLSARAGYRGQIGEAFALGAAAVAPVAMAARFEKAMLGVSKQVDGARDKAGNLTAEYHAMAKAIKMMGREIPITTNELAEMVASGARMGVGKNMTPGEARKTLIDFTRTSAMMASAFDLPASDLADNMGKIAGLYKIPIPAIGDLADTINWLDDNAISKGGDIIEYLQRVGGVAGAVKITGKQMAALGSTMLTLGETTETAGTSTNAIMQKFAAADKGTKKFKQAMQELGLSTAAVQKGMQIDAQGTLLEVLDKIAALPKDKQAGVMVELVGLEHSGKLAKLANGVDEYRKQIKLATSEEAKGSMSKEFEAQRKTTIAQWQMLKNRMGEVAVNIGTVLLPAVNEIIGTVGRVTSRMAEWAEAHPGITRAVVGTAVALTSLRVAAWAAGYAWTFVAGAGLAAQGAYLRAGAALAQVGAIGGRVAGLIRTVALAFMIAGAPIAAVVAAGAAVAVVGFAIWKAWEPIKAFFVGFGQGVVSGLAPVGKAMSDAFAPVWNIVKPVVMPVLEAIGGFFRDLFAPIDKASKTTTAFANAGRVCGEVIATAFGVMLTPVRLVLEAIKWIHDNVGGVIDKVAKVGGALSGGWQSAKDFVTGGNAPTLPPMRGAAAGAAAAPVQQTITNHITQLPGENAEQLARRTAELMRQQQGVQRRSALTDSSQ